MYSPFSNLTLLVNRIYVVVSQNGVLLSPNVDSLFDRHLISFKENGEILFSKMLSETEIKKLGIPKDIKIPISDGMKPYLKKHRSRFYEND